MTRISHCFSYTGNRQKIKKRMAQWVMKSEDFIILDSNNYNDSYSTYDFIIACGTVSFLRCYQTKDAIDLLDKYQKKTNDWLFGHCSYDLKNDIEQLSSSNQDLVGFPELSFFQPKKIIFLKEKELEFSYTKSFTLEDIKNDFDSISSLSSSDIKPSKSVSLHTNVSKGQYGEIFNRIIKEIQKGNVYELNYCQEFLGSGQLSVLDVYFDVQEQSKAPFSVLYRCADRYLISASPERYIKKQATTLISQPIKGTAPRGKSKSEDIKLKNILKLDPKEQAENTMIVDLVRNDMTKISIPGSVFVEEFQKIYTFELVHQMISTIRSTVNKDLCFAKVLLATFPMGSMTGAPKLRAMKLIDELESMKRGIYSGCVGYISPSNDFDFNVVIRGILYNSINHYISIRTGGAITYLSTMEQEYQENRLKAIALIDILKKGKNTG